MNNSELIIKVLESLSLCYINYNNMNNYISFAKDENSSPIGCNIYIDTLKYNIYSLGEHGDIFTLIQSQNNISFFASIRYLCDLLNIQSKPVHLPFGGLFSEVSKPVNSNTLDLLKSYDTTLLDNYKSLPNYHFIKEQIDYDTQVKFRIGRDFTTNRITIPHFDINGNLVGIMGRHYNKDIDSEYRYRPIIKHSKSQNVYGLYENYNKIIEKDLLLIGESEKFVMQLSSMGIPLGCAVCTCNISHSQSLIIKSMNISNIILCFDEGINEVVLQMQCEKLLSNNVLSKNKVGYLFDKDNIFLPKHSKQSPTDIGMKKFKEFLRTAKFI